MGGARTQQLPRLGPITWAPGARGSSANSDGGPGPRCGHSLTPVVSDQGPRLILFGGATALEGSGSGSGSSGIRTPHPPWLRLHGCSRAAQTEQERAPRACQ